MAEPCFTLESVSFAYGATPALDGIELVLPAGRFYGLVGPNGCGKTTLLDLLCGFRSPAQGTIRFLGRRLADYRRRDLARLLALVPQEFGIDFAFTVAEVVLMGRHPHLSRFAAPGRKDWQLAEEAMRKIGILHLRNRLVTELSGGEKQRVVAARALAQQTPVLLLDEATSNLDIRHTLEIFRVVRQRVLDHGHTVISAIHNLNLAAAFCDELIFINQGKIAARGDTARVLTPTLIAEVFGVECAVRHDPFSKARQISFRYHPHGD